MATTRKIVSFRAFFHRIFSVKRTNCQPRYVYNFPIQHRPATTIITTTTAKVEAIEAAEAATAASERFGSDSVYYTINLTLFSSLKIMSFLSALSLDRILLNFGALGGGVTTK